MKHPAGEVDGPEILRCATKTRLEKKTDRVIIESHRGAAKRGDRGKLESKRDEEGLTVHWKQLATNFSISNPR